MIEEFEGLDRVIPRPVRHDLITWRDKGQITISRITLPDQPAEPADTQIAYDLRARWVDHNPLRRAALAALQYLGVRTSTSATWNSPATACRPPAAWPAASKRPAGG
ncbi:hypothetical protein [Streptomyces sp. 1222.5]|uniref:hypothetical protein n=1 Tax=Streptomyces sp. 1222.5 TaxID=1881026 RepID=UPI003EBAA7E2